MRKMTQEQLAIRCDMSGSSISRIENYEAIPDALQLKKIATALGTDVGNLYNEKLTPADSIVLHRFSGELHSIHKDVELLMERLNTIADNNERLNSTLQRLITYGNS